MQTKQSYKRGRGGDPVRTPGGWGWGGSCQNPGDGEGGSCQDPSAYRFEALLRRLMDQLIGDSQIPPGSQAVGSGTVADVSAAGAPPVPALLDFMDVLSHPDVQAGATPEPPPLAPHDALGGVVAGAVGLLINSLLPVTTDRLQVATCRL